MQQISQTVFGQFVRSGTCGTCGGEGLVVEHPCDACEGRGRIVVDKPLEVDVPAGIHDGQRIRVRGAGHAGALGGPSGDVFVQVRVQPQPGLEREGDDLHAVAEITMIEAALGTEVRVEIPDGEQRLELAPGTQPGAVRVVRGKGMPSLQTGRRGNLHVHVDVRVPTRLTAEQREQLLRLDETLGEAAFADEGEDGFFGRLRDAFR
jgi:molecular chaperone DnaJ